VIDPTRFVVDGLAAKKYPELAYVALRLPVMAAGFVGAGTVLAAVRAEHMAFYKRVLKCTKLADPRPYLQLTKPLGLMAVNYPKEHEKVAKHPFFSWTQEEATRILS
jgi:hypothetical protein